MGRVRIHLDRRILWPALFGLLEPGLDHTLSLIGLTWTTWLGAILILFSVGSIFRMQHGETDLLSAVHITDMRPYSDIRNVHWIQLLWE